MKPARRNPAKSGFLSNVVAVALFVGLIYACMDKRPPHLERTVSASQMGDDWPLTVSGGRVRAYRNDARITFLHDGREYGLNGIARGAAWKLDQIESIWRPGSNIGPLIDVGLELQEQVKSP